MKKKIAVGMGLSAIIAASFTIGAWAATDIKLIINGKNINSDIQIIDGSSYVPLRVVSESLGADVKWDGDSRTITINGGSSSNNAVKSEAKSYNVNVNVESGPMRMKISKVTLDPAYKPKEYYDAKKSIVLDVTVENVSDDKIVWSPQYGKLVLNTKEQVERGSFFSDEVGGEFIGKVVKTGKIVFEVKGDLNSVNSMNYVIDGAVRGDTYTKIGDNKTVDIVLK